MLSSDDMRPDDSAPAPVAFSRRFRGFDPEEVRAFIENLASDYARVVRELEHATKSLEATPTQPTTTPSFQSSAREVEHILAAAARIGEEMRARAEQERGAVLKDAESRAAAIIREAEHRASEIIDDAARQVDQLARQAETIRGRYTQMRTAFEAGLEAAASGLRATDDEVVADDASRQDVQSEAATTEHT